MKDNIQFELRIIYSILIFLVLPIPHQIIGFEDSFALDFTIGYNLIASSFLLLVPSSIISLLIGMAFAWVISPKFHYWAQSNEKNKKIEKIMLIISSSILIFDILIYPPFLNKDFAEVESFYVKDSGRDLEYCKNLPEPLMFISNPRIRQEMVQTKDLCFLHLIEGNEELCSYVKRPGSNELGPSLNVLCIPPEES